MSLAPQAPITNLFIPRFHENVERLRARWSSFVILGAALVVVGFAAVGSSAVATIATVQTFGVMLLISGAIYLGGSAISRDWEGFFLCLLAGVLHLAAGVVMLIHPVQAAEVYTLFLALFFLVEGLFEIAAALTGRFRHWAAVLFQGLITLSLGVMILMKWPYSGIWVIGLFVGINLLVAGGSYIGLGLRLKNLPVHPHHPQSA